MLTDTTGLTESVVLMLDGRPAGRVRVDGEITTGDVEPSVVKALANGHVDKIYRRPAHGWGRTATTPTETVIVGVARLVSSKTRIVEVDGPLGPRTSSSLAPEIRDTDRRRLASRSRRPDRRPVLSSRRARLAISG